MGDFFKMTEDEIVAEAMKAVIPDYLEWIRSTGRFDVERCVELFGGFSSGGTSCHPGETIILPVVRNRRSPTPVTIFVASYSQAG